MKKGVNRKDTPRDISDDTVYAIEDNAGRLTVDFIFVFDEIKRFFKLLYITVAFRTQSFRIVRLNGRIIRLFEFFPIIRN